MARIRAARTGNAATADGLIEPILKAIKNESQTNGPVIFEVRVGSTDFVEVIVVWNEWSDLPADTRTRIVAEAYQRAAVDGVDVVTSDRISTILPVTVNQALEMGILPYAVQCSVHRSEERYARIRDLMTREGAIETESGIELRLPTLELARAARDTLQTETRDFIPEVHWQIARQVGQIQ